MKLLSGSELVGYIKERQAKQVRNLRQSYGVLPKLAIVVTIDDEVTGVYTRLKKAYGEDILIDVELHAVDQKDARATIEQLNTDPTVHGIILQLPLADPSQTDDLVNAVSPEKDVDGLGQRARFTPATPLAIDWLLVGYNVELTQKKIAIVGQGRLVGTPLYGLWKERGLDVTTFDETTDELPSRLSQFDIIVTATGHPGLIRSESIAIGAVVVDAGTASENGRVVGDVAPEVRERSDLTITPEKGGVGPLTVAALFDNVITAARQMVKVR